MTPILFIKKSLTDLHMSRCGEFQNGLQVLATRLPVKANSSREIVLGQFYIGRQLQQGFGIQLETSSNFFTLSNLSMG